MARVVTPVRMGNSLRKILERTISGFTRAVTPSIRAIFAILEPYAFPSPMPEFPLIAASAETTISGGRGPESHNDHANNQ